MKTSRERKQQLLSGRPITTTMSQASTMMRRKRLSLFTLVKNRPRSTAKTKSRSFHYQSKSKCFVTVANCPYSEGLMYNPVNMHVEDEPRLKERDLREKNKKKRYEIRYDFEQVTRKETLAEQDRLDNMALNKVKYDRV